MRLTFRMSASGPDGAAPVLADVLGPATTPLDGLIDAGRRESTLPTVPPHGGMRFVFSEPMASTSVLTDPQDPAGFQAKTDVRSGGGALELATDTEAGLIPGEVYTVSFLPPRTGRLSPVEAGSVDLSGEPLGKLDPESGTAGASDGQVVELTFRTGPLRIEQPRHKGEAELFGDAPLAVELIARAPESGDPAAYELSVRDHEPGQSLSSGWEQVDFFPSDDPRVETTNVNGLKQGELVVDVNGARLPLDPVDVVDACGTFDGSRHRFWPSVRWRP